MRKFMAAVLILLIVFVTFISIGTYADDYIENEPVVGAVTAANGASSLAVPKVDAPAAIAMDSATGRVLYEKNARVRRAMASTTKIMTAILALENGNTEDMVTVSRKAAEIWGSTIDLKAGQSVKLIDLLYGLMLNSGNDAAIAIAEHIGGTLEGFLEMMNAKAAQLGLNDTSYRSPHGLDMPEHYSTAYDLAALTRYALQNKTFAKLVSTKSANVLGRNMYNTNEMLDIFPGANGVKTGYTGQAGRCLVTSATQNNWQVISVVLGCPTRTRRAQDTRNILEYSFKKFKPYTLVKKGAKIDRNIEIIKGIAPSVDVYTADEVSMPLSLDEYNALETQIELPDKLDAPVRAGDVAGQMRFVIDGKEVASTKLILAADVRRKLFMDYFYDVLRMWGRMMRVG